MLFQNNLKLNFYGPDQADTLIQNEEADLKKKNEVGDIKTEAEAAVLRAISKLNKVEVKNDDEKGKKERRDASEKIHKARNQFEAVLGLVKRNIELKAAVAAIKPDKDFLNAVEKLAPLEKERDALKAAGLPEDTSVDAKKVEIRNLAKGYYDGVASKLDKELTIASKNPKDEVVAMMTAVSELQQAKFNKYPGLADGTDTKAYDAKIAEAVKKIEANAASVNDPEFTDSLKRFKFAQTNLAGAESSGAAAKESGHLAGAEQYMAMVLAEQEARRVWASLPRIDDPKNNWRGDKIGDDPTKSGQWDTNGENYKNYVAAQKDFNEALAKAQINENPGDSYKATMLFKSAADKWRLVVEKADLKKETDMKEQPESKNLLSKYTEVTDKKVLEKYLKPEHKALIELAKGEKKVEAKDVDGKLKEMAAATSDFDKLLKDLDTAREAYGKSRIQEAFNFYFTTLKGKGDLATTIYDFMNNQQYLKDVVGKMTYIKDPQTDLLLGHGVEYKNLKDESTNLYYDVAVKYQSRGPNVYVRDYGSAKDTHLYLVNGNQLAQRSAKHQEQPFLYPDKKQLEAPVEPIKEDTSVKDAAPAPVQDKPVDDAGVSDTGAHGAGSGPDASYGVGGAPAYESGTGGMGGAASDKAPEPTDAGTGGMPNASVDPAKMISKDPLMSGDSNVSQSI